MNMYTGTNHINVMGIDPRHICVANKWHIIFKNPDSLSDASLPLSCWIFLWKHNHTFSFSMLFRDTEMRWLVEIVLKKCIKSPASRWFSQPLVPAQIEENIKAPRRWPLWWEFTGDRWPFDDVMMLISIINTVPAIHTHMSCYKIRGIVQNKASLINLRNPFTCQTLLHIYER